jgi:hypothetical protein
MSVPHSDITVLNSEMSDFDDDLRLKSSAKVDIYMKIALVSGFLQPPDRARLPLPAFPAKPKH